VSSAGPLSHERDSKEGATSTSHQNPRGRIFLEENLMLDEAESRSYNSGEGKLLLHSSALAKPFNRVILGGEVLGR
jgi:hypothetical protein